MEIYFNGNENGVQLCDKMKEFTGVPDNFSEFYRKYEKLMYYIANDILKDSYEAEDVVQIAFMKIYEKYGGVADIESMRTRHFVVTVTRRVAIDIYRRRQRVREFFLDDVEEIDKNVQEEILSENNEVVECIKRLPKKYADVLILKYVQGYTAREIAELIGIPQGTVQARLFKGKRHLQEELKKSGIHIRI